MGVLVLVDPVAGTTTDATQQASNNAAIKTVINGGIDATNFAAGLIFNPNKIQQAGASLNQGLVWDGAKWNPATLPGAGFTTLADITLGAPAASIDSGVFSTAGYNHLKIFAALQDTQAAVSLNTLMRVNNDSTAADYYALNENGINSALSVGTAIGSLAGWVVGDHPGSSASTIVSNIEIDMQFSTTVRKHGFFSRSMNNADGSNANMIYRTAGGLHNVAAAISRVAFFAGTNFVTGSRIIVLGY